MSNFTKWHLTHEITGILPGSDAGVFTILVKFDILFLGLPWETVFGVITAS